MSVVHLPRALAVLGVGMQDEQNGGRRPCPGDTAGRGGCKAQKDATKEKFTASRVSTAITVQKRARESPD